MNRLTQQHRASQLLIRRSTTAGVARLWSVLDWQRLDETYPALAVRLAALTQRNAATSSGVAADYLRAMRRAAGIRDTARPTFPDPLNPDQFSTSLHSTSVAPLKVAAARGEDPDVALAAALTLATGAVVRLVLNAGRDTLTATTAADPAAAGWRRVLGGGGCDYCQERAGVLITSDDVFEAHDHCGCTAEPAY